MSRIDLNCDLGESFGAYTLGQDRDMLDYVTSVNIACGYHAGDPKTMRETVEMAVEKGIGIGAHPGFPDLNGFGRRPMQLTEQEIYDLILYQLGALEGFIRVAGGHMQHVKPHGALYNMASVDTNMALAIAKAIHDYNPSLILFGLSGSKLIEAGRDAGLETASEVFADRTYQEDGTLTSRRSPDALIQDDQEAVSQVIRMVLEGKVKTQQNTDVLIQADTVCLHGDGPHALSFAKLIRTELSQAGVVVKKLID
ncbi:LamB/YcsF family protein [Pullulanibacillus sp. KACC 23026]|uniref:LamB/YcsF family protein n=1 Tax=Pullulanibacillus sp. KACC 23026 TaxID=3028315 RepID=UPI0023B1F4DA|nr:5-oxoprolinase subunit PxpA [Pullulanibacillus sp. KACC 23026]WEG12962.1 LamB/YcsF family protein [Pullulanibacillus sp. KACC 23026]